MHAGKVPNIFKAGERLGNEVAARQRLHGVNHLSGPGGSGNGLGHVGRAAIENPHAVLVDQGMDEIDLRMGRGLADGADVVRRQTDGGYFALIAQAQQFLEDLGAFGEGIGQAGPVQVHDIEPLDPHLAQGLFHMSPGCRGIRSMRFGGDAELSGKPLYRLADMGVGAVKFRRVKPLHAPLQGMADQRPALLGTQVRLQRPQRQRPVNEGRIGQFFASQKQ